MRNRKVLSTKLQMEDGRETKKVDCVRWWQGRVSNYNYLERERIGERNRTNCGLSLCFCSLISEMKLKEFVRDEEREDAYREWQWVGKE